MHVNAPCGKSSTDLEELQSSQGHPLDCTGMSRSALKGSFFSKAKLM